MRHQVLVTGGSGFIGKHVVRELVRRGYCVRVLDRRDCDVETSPELEYFKVDLRNPDETLSLFKGFRTCIALAARSAGIGYFNEHPAEMLDDNLRILSSTFGAAQHHSLERILYVSSSCVFDNSDAHPIQEQDLAASRPPEPGYPFSKYVGEFLCRAYWRQYAMPYTIIRPFNVYGPGELPTEKPGESHVIPDLVKKILEGQYPLEIFGSGAQTRSFTHVSDVTTGLIQALECPKATNEDFNLGPPEDQEISVCDLARKLWSICRRTESFAAKTVGRFPIDVRRRAVRIDKARSLLSWQPSVSLDQGLAEYVSWYRGVAPRMAVH